MKLSKKQLLVNIFKFTEQIFDIYCQNKDMADFLNLQGRLKPVTLTRGEDSLIKVTGRRTLRFLPRVVQQLNMLRIAEQDLIFGTLEWSRYPIVIVLEWTNEKNVT